MSSASAARLPLWGPAGELGDAFLPLAADIARDEAIATIGATLTWPVAMVVHAPGLPVAGGIR